MTTYVLDASVAVAAVRPGERSHAAARARLARLLVTIGPRSAQAICGVVDKTQLRAADAAYVWVAITHGLPLVTLDHEIGKKAAGLCRVEPP